MFRELSYSLNYQWIDNLIAEGSTYEEIVDKSLDRFREHLLTCLIERERYLEKDNEEKTSNLINYT